MGKLRYGDVYEIDHEASTVLEIKWRLKPRWKIWLAWFFRLLGWNGDPT